MKDIKNLPYAGLEQPQEGVSFSYSIGRENKINSDGCGIASQHRRAGVEFARRVTQAIDAPVAIISARPAARTSAATELDDPIGFKMYPLALKLVRDLLAELKRQGVRYRLEGFMWHQGENDMFNEDYMKNYGPNLKNYLAAWRAISSHRS